MHNVTVHNSVLSDNRMRMDKIKVLFNKIMIFVKRLTRSVSINDGFQFLCSSSTVSSCLDSAGHNLRLSLPTTLHNSALCVGMLCQEFRKRVQQITLAKAAT